MATKKKIKRPRRKTVHTTKRIAMPYQFGKIGALKTHYYDLYTGDELGPKPNSTKYRIIRASQKALKLLKS